MKINLFELNKAILKSRTVETSVDAIQQASFELAKRRLIDKFRSHPVSRELQAGPTAQNVSQTLGGRGNLFSFIGFPEGSDPIRQVETILQTQVVLIKVRKQMAGVKAQFVYRAILPTNSLRASTPMPFESGNSWLYGIEEGISGFSHYINKRLKTKKSRSGHGVQIEADLGGEYAPTPYISQLFQEFLIELAL